MYVCVEHACPKLETTFSTGSSKLVTLVETFHHQNPTTIELRDNQTYFNYTFFNIAADIVQKTNFVLIQPAHLSYFKQPFH